MPEDYWLPVRQRWDALIPMLLEPGHGPRESKFVIKPRLNFFASPDVAIAITGMRGTGKSTLLKALRRRLWVGGYEQRGESPKAEPDRFVAHTEYGKKQIQVVVVPGQKDSAPGKRSQRQYFQYGASPSGVVHVVSWGYSTIWDVTVEQVAMASTTLPELLPDANPDVERVRAYNLKGELDDFRQTCALLKESWRLHAKPLWLVITVSKADLFRDERSARLIRDYYIPAERPEYDTPFAHELRALVNNLGEHRFDKRIAVLPLVSYLEDYSAGETTVVANGNLDLISALMTNLTNTIGEFSGGREA